MTDKEDLTYNLRASRKWMNEVSRLSAAQRHETAKYINRVLYLLEPVPPVHKPEWRENYYVCGNCGGWITKPRRGIQEGDNYCSRCGREIQWE